MEPDQDLFTILGHPKDRPEPSKQAATLGRPDPDATLGTQLRASLAARYYQAAPGERTPFGANKSLRIDDRNGGDVYAGFCDLFVTIPDNPDGLFLLELHHPPRNAEVEDLIAAKGGRVGQVARDTTVLWRVPIRPTDSPFLRRLARAIRRVTARGQTYPDPNWKWLAPRTATSLERLAGHLTEFRRSANTHEHSTQTARATRQHRQGQPADYGLSGLIRIFRVRISTLDLERRVFEGRADEDEYLIEGTVENVEFSEDESDEEDDD